MERNNEDIYFIGIVDKLWWPFLFSLKKNSWETVKPDAEMSCKICHDKATADKSYLVLHGTNATFSLHLKSQVFIQSKNN